MLARRRLGPLLYLVFLAVLLALSAASPDGLRKARRNEAEARRLERENAALEARVAAMRREVRALTGDPAALERAAREDLGYVGPGEVVIQLPQQLPEGLR